MPSYITAPSTNPEPLAAAYPEKIHRPKPGFQQAFQPIPPQIFTSTKRYCGGQKSYKMLRPYFAGPAMDTTGSPKKLAGRYEVRQILGQGGMGLVYRAYDTVVRREVAVKTILDIPDPASLQLFHKECDVLASMSHPNIVEIFDIGEF